MSDLKQIEWGLEAYLAANSPLTALLAEFESKPAIFAYTAPPGAESPYICYFPMDISPDDTYETRSDNALFQINVHAFKISTAYDIYSLLDDLLHRQTYSITGYTNLFVKRVRGISRLQQEEGEELLGLSADYLVMVQD
jgi:hypothetical protein